MGQENWNIRNISRLRRLNSQKPPCRISHLLKGPNIFFFFLFVPITTTKKFLVFLQNYLSFTTWLSWLLWSSEYKFGAILQVENIYKYLAPQQPGKSCVGWKVVLRKNARKFVVVTSTKKEVKGIMRIRLIVYGNFWNLAFWDHLLYHHQSLTPSMWS